ncbi:putative reverse transcriptase domain-containing protein [Tanacetum coccineum]
MAPSRRSGNNDNKWLTGYFGWGVGVWVCATTRHPDNTTALSAQQIANHSFLRLSHNTNNVNNANNVMEEMVVVEMEMVGTTDALSRHSNLVIPRSMMLKGGIDGSKNSTQVMKWRNWRMSFGITRWWELIMLPTQIGFMSSPVVPQLITPLESSRLKGPAVALLLRYDKETAIGRVLARRRICGKDNQKAKVFQCNTSSTRKWIVQNVGNKLLETGSFPAKDCQVPSRQVASVNTVRMSNNPRVCYECGSPDHFRNTCPKMNRVPGQAGNQLALEDNCNNQSNGNQVRGRAYNVNVNAMEAVQDPNVVTSSLDGKKLEVDMTLSVTANKLGEWIGISQHKARDNISRESSRNTVRMVGILSDFNGSEPRHLKDEEDHDVHLSLGVELLKGMRSCMSKFSKCEFWLQENQKYIWDVEQEEAFQTLKNNLCDAPILTLPDGVEDFIVYCDASNQGLGCVTSCREQKLFAYSIDALKIHEKNNTTHDLDLGAVVFSLKTWRHYLYGTKSVIYTDHKSLQHIFDQKEMNMRHRRWIELFSDYECEIRCHPGKANVVADALSKKDSRLKP